MTYIYRGDFSISLFFCICGLAESKELSIKDISQSAMSRLRKRHHLNVDVRKQGSVFAKCTIYESLKDLISKLGKNSMRF